MFMKHHSLLKAEAIVKLVMCDQELKESTDFIIIGAYQNGREQGLTLSPRGGKVIYVSENRNSDNIVVYFGSDGMQGLSDDAWENRIYFKHDEYTKSAEFICELLKQIIREEHNPHAQVKEE